MRTVLITGCSSGIGHDAACFLRERGWRVLASARAGVDVEHLRSEGFESIQIDIADEASIARGVRDAVALGPVHALVNNAAFATPGAVEDLPRGALREIFETNLFGTHDLTRALIPHFREQGAGRIVNISSVLGLIGARWRGAYVASKYALEGLTDVLRLELQDTPIKVVLIQPGPITSRFRANAIPHFERWIEWRESARADQYRDSLLKRLYEPRGPDRFERPPRAVSTVILHAIEAPSPKARYRVTVPTHVVAAARRVLGGRALDWLARQA